MTNFELLNLSNVAFIDLEVDSVTEKIIDAGAILENIEFHENSLCKLINTIKDAEFFCGHNVFAHDLKYLGKALEEAGLENVPVIDTLVWSPLLFPRKPYHKLVKDNRLDYELPNNPLNDSKSTKNLLYDEIAAFNKLSSDIQAILYLLLGDQKEFSSFFKLLGFSIVKDLHCENLIKNAFSSSICQSTDLLEIIKKNPVELAYCLALISTNDRDSLTPRWVSINYPKVENLMFQLTNQRCSLPCSYCQKRFDAIEALKRHFHFSAFRTFDNKPLQENAVRAVIEDNKSILAVFPTGGGKSITFQLPALVAGETAHALTVVISPLQSLMKDQVDNLEKKDITAAVTINGLLDPIERQKAFERAESGQASIIYLSPESLRSHSIERLLLSRNIARFVIDEAHCFSAWGQDFRVDYLYIGDFIKNLQEKKKSDYRIPVSCFTATAKLQVIEDIKQYFKSKLNLELETFTAAGQRKNLVFKVIEVENPGEKYKRLRDLIDEKRCPTIVYTSRTKRTEEIAQKLTNDNYMALPYHGKMLPADKTSNQEKFINGEVDIIVATSAFGMGVDKSNVKLVVHYDISDSLENYIQEAGRAARDENLTGECYVLFNEGDLNKHFILLNQTRINQTEIDQVWKAIKQITKQREKMSSSALEIARQAGWDDSVREIETRVITAIAALEAVGYLKRGQNNPRVFANSIQVKTAAEARERIEASGKFANKDLENAVRIMSKLLSGLRRANAQNQDGETRVDYIADHLGLNRKDIIRLINLLREEGILGDAKDLTAEVKSKVEKKVFAALETYFRLERLLLKKLSNEKVSVNFKEINGEAINTGVSFSSVKRLKALVNFWAIKGWLKQRPLDITRDNAELRLIEDKAKLSESLEKRQKLATFILKSLLAYKEKELKFSILELRKSFESENRLLQIVASSQEIEDALFYLSRIGAISIDGGFMIIYNRLQLERLEQDNRRRFKKEDYQSLENYYKSKTRQIHIVGEYAKLHLEDYRKALRFVEDYFSQPFEAFIKKYFPGERRTALDRNITPGKFEELFGELSPRQLSIITEKDAKRIVVAAGPGSGKTRVLAHKLASLILLEDAKHEQLLMLTFSRAAVTEFKKRLFSLIHNAANLVEIKTFHSYCFDLLGKIGNLNDSDEIIEKAIKAIKTGMVEKSRITKSVLVIDEAQDISKNEFELIKTLIEENENLRVIAVGDDDQNIYEFRGSNSRYLKELLKEEGSKKFELVENYRSCKELVELANHFVRNLEGRLKKETLESKNAAPGLVEFTWAKSCYLFEPMVNKIVATKEPGTCCVLTQTNEDAMLITSMLQQKAVKARLIQTNQNFRLANLVEVRDFLNFLDNKSGTSNMISMENWQNAVEHFSKKYKDSVNFRAVERLLEDYSKTTGERIFMSDFREFLNESRLEDFFTADASEILVSTIHKAKGKEFDTVYLMLKDFEINTQEKRHQFYVAITRAKTRLFVLTNNEELQLQMGNKHSWKIDNSNYGPPKELVINAGFKDVYLDHFRKFQANVDVIFAGSSLKTTPIGCNTESGKPCVKYSAAFLEKLNELENKGYRPEKAEAGYVFWWQKQQETETNNNYPEIKVILPRLYLKRIN